MGKKLVIVESPAKAKTIKKYLGKDFDVTASVGHIEDLPEKKLGVDIENGFEPEYEIMKGKKKLITDLKKMVKNHDEVYLATDQDREGEAISWHLIRVLNLKDDTKRIAFHEITKTAIQKAISNPRQVDMNLVNAQQGRRILDRLVGYTVSPVLWKKIKMGLSAGRVQSVAVKLIVEKENEIKNFKSSQIWDISSDLENNIKVKLEKIKNKKIEFKIEKKVLDFLSKIGLDINNFDETKKDFKISDLQTKQVKSLKFNQKVNFELVEKKKSKSKRTSPAPFITSTLQQEASSKLGWGVKQVMQVAQKLYEQGLITYMRTDDPSLSPQAIKQAEKVIKDMFGEEYSKPIQYKSKSKNAQEAHEAIRPTDLSKTLQDLSVEPMQARLYQLIWNRTIASQMSDAQVDITTYNFSTGNDDIWMIKGEVIKFDGFLKVYGGGKNIVLPDIKKLEKINSKIIFADQKWIKGPTRFTESSLVKKMESLGIGRPSTYAAVISTIINRGYIEKTDEKKLKPTDISFSVVDFLQEEFSDMMDYKFTARMEEKLDEIAIGKVDWKKMMKQFWDKFSKNIEKAGKGEKKLEKTGKKCPDCGADLVYKFGRFGKFIACSNYPDCKHKEQTEQEQDIEKKLNEKYAGKPCPAGGVIEVKKSRNGYFLASSKYPDIKWAMSPDVYEISKDLPEEKCDKCGEGKMIVRKGRRGYFLACDKYPKCKNIKSLPKKENT